MTRHISSHSRIRETPEGEADTDNPAKDNDRDLPNACPERREKSREPARAAEKCPETPIESGSKKRRADSPPTWTGSQTPRKPSHRGHRPMPLRINTGEKP